MNRVSVSKCKGSLTLQVKQMSTSSHKTYWIVGKKHWSCRVKRELRFYFWAHVLLPLGLQKPWWPRGPGIFLPLPRSWIRKTEVSHLHLVRRYCSSALSRTVCIWSSPSMWVFLSKKWGSFDQGHRYGGTRGFQVLRNNSIQDPEYFNTSLPCPPKICSPQKHFPK